MSTGRLYLYIGSVGWQTLDQGIDSVASISMIGAGNAIFAVTTAGQLYVYLDQWVATGDPGDALTAVAAGPTIWGITENGAPVQLMQELGWLEAGPFAVQNAGRDGPEWANDNPYNESLSTHLWLVNRAAELAQKQGSIGQEIYGLVQPGQGQNGSSFHDNLCQALYDADYLPAYANPLVGSSSSLNTYSSHFYNPYTSLNWLGQGQPTALTNGRQFFKAAVGYYKNNDMANAGYNLGLALHYLTDMTQPMHATNFTFLNSLKLGYHTDFEGYCMEIQGTVSPPAQYTPSNLSSADDFIITAAKNAQDKYYAIVVPNGRKFMWYGGKFTSYYQNIVKSNLQKIFGDAITITSQFLVFWMSTASSSSTQA
jgi:hypothetical protein